MCCPSIGSRLLSMVGDRRAPGLRVQKQIAKLIVIKKTITLKHINVNNNTCSTDSGSRLRGLRRRGQSERPWSPGRPDQEEQGTPRNRNSNRNHT